MWNLIYECLQITSIVSFCCEDWWPPNWLSPFFPLCYTLPQQVYTTNQTFPEVTTNIVQNASSKGLSEASAKTLQSAPIQGPWLSPCTVLPDTAAYHQFCNFLSNSFCTSRARTLPDVWSFTLRTRTIRDCCLFAAKSQTRDWPLSYFSSKLLLPSATPTPHSPHLASSVLFLFAFFWRKASSFLMNFYSN